VLGPLYAAAADSFIDERYRQRPAGTIDEQTTFPNHTGRLTGRAFRQLRNGPALHHFLQKVFDGKAPRMSQSLQPVGNLRPQV
jgi:hypothetical protein